jgi:hypothetical protein
MIVIKQLTPELEVKLVVETLYPLKDGCGLLNEVFLIVKPGIV